MIKRSELLDQIERMLKANEPEIADALHVEHLVMKRSGKTDLHVTVEAPHYTKRFILRLVEPMS